MLQMKSVDFGYRKHDLFSGLNLTLEPGNCYGLLGLNGAGKTSLLKLAAGAVLPQQGIIELFGRNPAKRETAHLEDVYFVPEDPIAPAMTLNQWLKRIAVFRPRFDHSYFMELVQDFELEKEQKVSRWSYGQRKKFALAGALASGARLLLLDEPTNGLDIPGKGQLRRALSAGQDSDRITVLSTHQVRDLENLMDPLIFIHQGVALLEASMEDLSSRLSSARLNSLEGKEIVTARKDALGWAALMAEQGSSLDLEMVFEAAVHSTDRLLRVMAGQKNETFKPEEALS
ncbi:ATP-binding cassette domain-containing protein [Spirochaeta dissipatitropha]